MHHINKKILFSIGWKVIVLIAAYSHKFSNADSVRAASRREALASLLPRGDAKGERAS